MKNKNTWIILLAGLIVLGVAAAVVISGNKNSVPKTDLDSFARCLAEKNITMYGTKNCPYCRQEKSNFGKTFQYVPYVECDSEPQKCLEAKIEAVPTWIWPDGKRLTGYQGLEKLAGESGCPL